MKNINQIFVFGAIVLITATAGTMSDSGKSGKTDSPGEGNCSGCHNNTPVNTGGGSVVITSNIPNDMYTPGQTYQITVTVSEAGKVLFGLGVEALTSANANAGTFTITNTTETHLLTATNGRINVVHQLNGGLVVTPGSKAFSFDWTAPATDIGNVTFYAGSVAAIGDGDDANDNSYTTIKILSSPSTVGMNALPGVLQFSVYPNPVRDNLNIYFQGNYQGVIKVELFTITGQKTTELLNNNTQNDLIEKHIAVPSSVANGIYLLKISVDNNSSTRRIIIQR